MIPILLLEKPPGGLLRSNSLLKLADTDYRVRGQQQFVEAAYKIEEYLVQPAANISAHEYQDTTTYCFT